MIDRNYTVQEVCQRCSCDARYTTEDGTRVCSLHSMGRIAVRDNDIPDVLVLIDRILLNLCSRGEQVSLADVVKLRNLIGTTGTKG